ncbi:MAG: recombinase [Acidobacteria bacterium]|nr:MAG: recombinase [Acidobacteriota bacterium]
MNIRFTLEADAELAEARQWYAHQRADLDIEFMERIDDALSRIVRNPHLYPIVYRTLRRAVVRRFPFAVFYETTADEIQIIAVFHSRRDPKKWKSRVE